MQPFARLSGLSDPTWIQPGYRFAVDAADALATPYEPDESPENDRRPRKTVVPFEVA